MGFILFIDKVLINSHGDGGHSHHHLPVSETSSEIEEKEKPEPIVAFNPSLNRNDSELNFNDYLGGSRRHTRRNSFQVPSAKERQ